MDEQTRQALVALSNTLLGNTEPVGEGLSEDFVAGYATAMEEAANLVAEVYER